MSKPEIRSRGGGSCVAAAGGHAAARRPWALPEPLGGPVLQLLRKQWRRMLRGLAWPALPSPFRVRFVSFPRGSSGMASEPPTLLISGGNS